MKLKFLLIPIALLGYQTIFANPALPKIDVCPSIETIQAVGVKYAENEGKFGWITFNLKNRYDTQQYWDFVIYAGTAKDEKDALEKGKDNINSLWYSYGPTLYDSENPNAAVCIYAGIKPDKLILGLAFTPPSMIKDKLRELQNRKTISIK